jgi:hypothetical protein
MNFRNSTQVRVEGDNKAISGKFDTFVPYILKRCGTWERDTGVEPVFAPWKGAVEPFN